MHAGEQLAWFGNGGGAGVQRRGGGLLRNEGVNGSLVIRGQEIQCCE